MIKPFLDDLKLKGWKQREISAKAGISISFISNLQNGDTCGIDTVIKLAEAFGVSTDEVLGRKPTNTLSPTIERIKLVAAGDIEIERAALKCAEDQKLIKEVKRKRGEGTTKERAA
jgi:transcriptional regulator with XRE-family HTH domain